MHSCNLTVFYWAGTRAPQQNAVVAGSSGLVQSSSYSTCFIGPPPSCVQNGCSNTVQIAGLSLRNGQAMLDQEVTACAGRLWPRLNPRGTKTKIAFVALTQLRPCTNFLVLHYLATDSAQGWENFLSQCIPNGNWMPTTSRRAMLI